MEKPILFNADMVRAILDGRKTVTRRLVKKPWGDSCPHCRHIHNEFIYDNMAETVYCARCGEPLWINPFVDKGYKAPYQIVDCIYVRETWAEQGYNLLYKADFTNEEIKNKGYWFEKEKINLCDLPKWKPSIHMPKEAARIWLKVTDVKVERLQDITENQAQLEGSDLMSLPDIEGKGKSFIQGFGYIWNSTISPKECDRYGWNANPWVWVISFERCEKPEQDGAE